MRQWTVDAFASAPFRGNPACVVEPSDAWPDDGWMQALARENNQAETAYLLRTEEPARFGLRWFTPGQEVAFCGHATLASAHVLLAELGLDAPEVAFDTRSVGRLRVERAGAGYRLDFPAEPPRPAPVVPGLAEALGAPVRELWVGRYLFAVLDDEATVRRLDPDLAAIKSLDAGASDGAGNVVACAAAAVGAPYDVVSRMFGPGCGVPEDPTTGSAHCGLAPLWAGKLEVRAPLRFHQAYPHRGGDLTAQVRGERVDLVGGAVTTVEGRLRV